MIFKNASLIIDAEEKKIFTEQIQLYIRLVEVFCEKNKLDFKFNKNTKILDELIAIGVISSENDIYNLQKNIEKNFDKFIGSVKFVVENKSKIGHLLDNLYNSKRHEKQIDAKKRHKKTLVDFFCGAGGLSLGFLQSGFNVKFANDIEPICIQTYRYNHPELPTDKLIQGDIRQIVNNIDKYIEDPIDIVVGGPPCQGFSEANRQRVIDDPRNELYKYFLKGVEKIAPKFVVMENVKGMLKVSNQVVEDYENLKIEKDGHSYSYKVKCQILNSQNFSVAQNRERLFYIAIRNDIQKQKNITPEMIFKEIDEKCKNKKKYNLRIALENIKELEAPRIKNMNEIDSVLYGKKIDVNTYDNEKNEYLDLINQGRFIPYVFNHKARYVNDINYSIYKLLNQGDNASDEKISDIMPYKHRLHCFKDKYYKLIADKPCRTITAHLKMDCHSHIHPFQIRAITPREAARIQSFPDDYLFLGAYLKTYMQIGNAVPTLMARVIAEVIGAYL